ncbi:MAG: peptidoglycan-binding protein [Lachnospiraceae bacterium]
MKDGTLNEAGLNRKNSTENKDPFGEAATLELTHDYVKEKAASADMVSASRAATRTLKVGSRGDDVKTLQANLNLLGYNAGTPDGIFGNGTKNAVISFQKTYGLSADGIAGTNTLDAISTTVNRKNKNILSKGQVSNDVKDLQNNLITLGYLSGTADGAFGKNTENAVIAFQKKYGLTPDGLVGNTTRNKIKEIVSNNNPGTQEPNPKPTDNGTIRNVPIDTNYKNKNVNIDNATYVYNELIKAGFTKQSAAAVMGNLDVEHAFSTSWEGDQGSVGIAQWRGSRKTDLETYAKQQNGDVTDIKIQTSFMINVDMEKRLGKEGLKKLKNMTDYIDAADYFCDKFESPSSYKSRDEWLNGKYGPNYAEHGGTYQIKWERYEWSDQLQKYELDLKKRRSAARYWYNNMN